MDINELRQHSVETLLSIVRNPSTIKDVRQNAAQLCYTRLVATQGDTVTQSKYKYMREQLETAAREFGLTLKEARPVIMHRSAGKPVRAADFGEVTDSISNAKNEVLAAFEAKQEEFAKQTLNDFEAVDKSIKSVGEATAALAEKHRTFYADYAEFVTRTQADLRTFKLRVWTVVVPITAVASTGLTMALLYFLR